MVCITRPHNTGLGGRLATSGMPLPDDFAALRQAGFDVVTNLALPTSDNASRTKMNWFPRGADLRPHPGIVPRAAAGGL
jgi:hypothetical protein